MFQKWSRQPIWLLVLFFGFAISMELQAPYRQAGVTPQATSTMQSLPRTGIDADAKPVTVSTVDR